MKLCKCGCGQPTRQNRRAQAAQRLLKGEYSRFLPGHNARIQPRLRLRPGRWYAARRVDGKTEALHRLRAESALGKELPVGAIVHHADGSRNDDAPLVICENERYHRLLHTRMRIKRAGGNPNLDALCAVCGEAKPRAEFYPRQEGFGLMSYCIPCEKERQRQYRWRQSQQAADLAPEPVAPSAE